MTLKQNNIKLLRKHGLKPTTQRLFLSEILFSGKNMLQQHRMVYDTLGEKGLESNSIYLIAKLLILEI